LITERCYTTSAEEWQRRLRAFTTLIVSLLCGIALSSIDYLFRAPVFWLAGLGGLALLLVLARVALTHSVRSYAALGLRLDDTHIMRARGETVEKFALADITRVRIVRTSRKALREITAQMKNGGRLSMNGVEDFERLEQDLRSRIPASVPVTETREPIDYDHPLFYVVFGLIVGAAFTLAIRAMLNLSEGGLKWATLAIASYSALLGIYVLVARPLSQRYGPKSRFGDFLLGLSAVLAGVVLAARALTN
jgi:hypothetical protein